MSRTGRDRHAGAYVEAARVLAELDRLEASASFAPRRVAAHRALWHARADEAAAAYEGSLPATAVSRCPHTGDVLSLPIDLAGLDGPWWNHDVPRRPLPAGAPATLVGFDGAIAIEPPLPDLPYPVKLGPEVPTVVPRMLEGTGVIAVLSQLAIAGSTAYLTAYYAPQVGPGTPVLDEWGTDHYLGAAPDGRPVEVPVGGEERDPDLGAWMEEGALVWIAPGDHRMRLRKSRRGCPFLGIEGSAEVGWLIGGAVVRGAADAGRPGGMR
ncbi:MAG: hypothetical protein KQH83_06335 [Actinobacteria bacterium]|nr:hypothetical protein [Actinomycetota bacterium]